MTKELKSCSTLSSGNFSKIQPFQFGEEMKDPKDVIGKTG